MHTRFQAIVANPSTITTRGIVYEIRGGYRSGSSTKMKPDRVRVYGSL